MTNRDIGTNLKKEFTATALLCMTLIYGLMLSGEVGEYVKDGMRLAVECVVPTALPFMIVSDVYVCYGRPERIRWLKMWFESVFGLPGCGLAAFICGNISGFPIGAKMTSDLYRSGMLKRGDAQRLAALSNNPSCAFIVGGVGMGIYGDARLGFLLLISVYSATVLCGIITRKKRDKSDFAYINSEQKYDFIESVKTAGLSSVSIISFISIFSGINGIIKKRIKYAPALYLFSAVSEVTNAVKIFSSEAHLSDCLSLSLTAFALGFGGVCVGLQSSVFTVAAGLKMKNYYLIKLMEGILACGIFALLFITIK